MPRAASASSHGNWAVGILNVAIRCQELNEVSRGLIEEDTTLSRLSVTLIRVVKALVGTLVGGEESFCASSPLCGDLVDTLECVVTVQLALHKETPNSFGVFKKGASHVLPPRVP